MHCMFITCNIYINKTFKKNISCIKGLRGLCTCIVYTVKPFNNVQYCGLGEIFVDGIVKTCVN